MFVVLLRFAENKANAGQFMEAHNAWVAQGFEEKVFLLAGSLKPGLGGSILAHNSTLSDIEARVDRDPFVQETVVTAEILEIEAAKADDRLTFLLSDS